MVSTTSSVAFSIRFSAFFLNGFREFESHMQNKLQELHELASALNGASIEFVHSLVASRPEFMSPGTKRSSEYPVLCEIFDTLKQASFSISTKAGRNDIEDRSTAGKDEGWALVLIQHFLNVYKRSFDFVRPMWVRVIGRSLRIRDTDLKVPIEAHFLPYKGIARTEMSACQRRGHHNHKHDRVVAMRAPRKRYALVAIGCGNLLWWVGSMPVPKRAGSRGEPLSPKLAHLIKSKILQLTTMGAAMFKLKQCHV